MSAQGESNDQQRGGDSSNTSQPKGSSRRLFLLIGLLALAVFALWYDYKVARPAVEQAYVRVAAKNAEINNNAQYRRMTNADVQEALGRSPSETFPTGNYMIEAYRWRAGMPIELRGLNGDDSPGIGLKTHDYYAVYRQDGPQLAFVTHFKFDLDQDYFVDHVIDTATEEAPGAEEMEMMQAMVGGGGPRGGGGPGGGGPPGGPGGGGQFDPEAFFAERDADGDGKLAGEEISERMQARLDTIDTDKDGAVSKEEFVAGMSRRGGGGGAPGGAGGGPGQGPGGEGAGRRRRPPLEEAGAAPAAEAAPSDAAPAAESNEAPAETTTEKSGAEPAPEATETSEETAQEESGSES